MKIAEIMTTTVATAPESATLADAARLMWDRDCGIVPIIAEDGTIRGVITDRDVCMGGLTQGRPLHEIPVTASMTTDPFTCRATDDISAVHHLMRLQRIRRLPVLDEQGRLAGIVSLNDLAQVAQKATNSLRRHQEAEVARSLAAICQHREVEVIPLPADKPREIATTA